MNDQTEVSIQFKNSITKQKALKEYVESLKQINSYLSAIDTGKAKVVEDVAKSTNKMANKSTTDSVKTLGNNLTTAFKVTKLIAFRRAFERTMKEVSTYTKKSADFLENWNLLDVAFQNNTKEAEKFVNTLTEMYGLDESWGYRTVGIFKQLSNAMGLTDEVGTKLSKTLTQLAIDTSSLYNIDVEDTVSILQSGLAGQTKPVRRLGGDITQTTLQLTLDAYGIDETINQLTYAEKRLVIVTALLNQTEEASGDWGRTIESVANQMRIFQQQVERLTRAIGNVFLPILKAILPYMNAIIMVLTEIISWLALLVGYDPDEFDFFSGASDSVIDLKENLDGAGESAKKLQSGLRSFDKLNVIKTPTASSSGVGGGMNGVDPEILEMFNKASDDYLNNLSNVEMKATKIRDKIMEWLGFTKLVDEKTKDISFKFDHITSGTVLGTLAVGGTIFNGVKTILALFSKIGVKGISLKGVFSGISKIVGTIGKALGVGGGSVLGIVVLLVAQFTSIRKETQKFADALKSGNLSEYFKIDGIDDVISKIFTLTSLLTGGLIPVLVSLGIEFGIFDDTLNIISEILQPIIDKFVNLGTYLKEELIDFWKKDLEPTFKKLNTIWKENMKPALDELGKFLDDIFLKSGLLKSGFESLLTFVGGVFVVGITLAIDTILIPFKLFFEYIQGMVSGIIKIFTGIIKFITGVFTLNWKQAWTGVKDIFVGIWVVLSTVIKTPINAIILVIESFVNLVITGLNAIIGALNKLSVTIPDWVPEFGGKTWGINIKKAKEITIPRLKTGLDFVPNDYYPAYLDYGERVLTKEENADYNKGIINGKNSLQPFNATFIIQVGNEELTTKVLDDLQSMARSNGEPITIGA